MVLDDVHAENRRACTALEVEEPQQRFVASVAYYLALCAYGDNPWRPLAVRSGDEVVGCVMWGIDPADESFWIGGLIIDRRHFVNPTQMVVYAGAKSPPWKVELRGWISEIATCGVPCAGSDPGAVAGPGE